MSEFSRRLKERVDVLLAPHRDTYGSDAPVVRIGMRILQAAEDVEREMMERRVLTAEAADLTGWSVDTLQRQARTKLAGSSLRGAWAGLDVVESPDGYAFVLATIPQKVQAAS